MANYSTKAERDELLQKALALVTPGVFRELQDLRDWPGKRSARIEELRQQLIQQTGITHERAKMYIGRAMSVRIRENK